ncbi:hypothetical protein K0M31_000592, partial [Melipona bicolor]
KGEYSAIYVEELDIDPPQNESTYSGTQAADRNVKTRLHEFLSHRSQQSKMPFTADAAATQIQERLKNLYHLVHEIETQRVRSEHNLNNIMKSYEKVTPEDKVVPVLPTEAEDSQRGDQRLTAGRGNPAQSIRKKI